MTRQEHQDYLETVVQVMEEYIKEDLSFSDPHWQCKVCGRLDDAAKATKAMAALLLQMIQENQVSGLPQHYVEQDDYAPTQSVE